MITSVYKSPLFGLIALVIVIAGGYFAFSLTSADRNVSIKIGAAIGLSGVCADWGEGELKAEQLAVDDANANGGVGGKNIQLIVEDTQCTPNGTANAVEKLISVDHVALILGPTWGDSFQAGTVLSNKAHIPAISPSTALEALVYNKQPIQYVYSTWFPEHAEIDTLQAYAQRNHETKIAVISDEDPFASMMAGLYISQAPSRGLAVVDNEKFPIGDTDFRTLIVKLKALKPDGVFVAFEGAGPKVRFLEQARELGLDIQLFSSSDIEDNSLLSQFGTAMDGIIYTRPKVSGNQTAFTNEYEARYKTPPAGQSVTNAYDAARVAIVSLEEHAKNGTDLNQTIAQTTLAGTAVETVQFNKDHQLTGAMYQIKTIRNGQFVAVSQ